jgi:uncharacterized membrane protein
MIPRIISIKNIRLDEVIFIKAAQCFLWGRNLIIIIIIIIIIIVTCINDYRRGSDW